MQDKLQAWIDKLNEWGARLADVIASTLVPRPKPVPVRAKDGRPAPGNRRLMLVAAASFFTLSLSIPGGAEPASSSKTVKAPASPTSPLKTIKRPPAPIKKPVATAPVKSGGGLGDKPTAVKKPEKIPVRLAARFDSKDLERIFVGNQAGLLKIYSREKSAIFVKDAPGTDMRGVDGTQWAPLTDAHRVAIFSALEIGDNEIVELGRKLMSSYRSLAHPRTAIALLGIIGSYPAERLPSPTSMEIRQFLSGLLASEKEVAVRRQAVLALALCTETDAATVKSVISFMTASHNAWETFTTRQFFEYHKDYIRALPESVELKGMLRASGNPYSADIVNFLN